MIYLAYTLATVNLLMALIPFFKIEPGGARRVLTYNNIFNAGLIHFQLLEMFQWLTYRRDFGFWHVVIRDKNYETSVLYSFMMFVYLILHQVNYRIIRNRLQRKQGPLQPVPIYRTVTSSQAVRTSLLMTVVGIGIWLGGKFAGFDSAGLVLASGFGAAATGFAMWSACDTRNPLLWLFTFVTAFLHFIPHLTSYGRRGLVSILIMLVWVLYYRYFGRLSHKKIFVYGAIMGLPILTGIAAFSEARISWPKTTGEALENLQRVDLTKGFESLTSFHGSTVISMWCLETYPEKIEYRPLNTIVAFVGLPVPRQIWRDKPEGLGVQIPGLAGMRGYGGLNVGAGLIGHIGHEGRWPTLVIYALLFSSLIAVADFYVLNTKSLFTLIPMGCALGQLYAFPRGELSYFWALLTISTFSTLLFARTFRNDRRRGYR